MVTQVSMPLTELRKFQFHNIVVEICKLEGYSKKWFAPIICWKSLNTPLKELCRD